VVSGAENVARRAQAFSRRGVDARPALVNGAIGFVSLLDGDVYSVAAITLRNGRIVAMDFVLDPARLARVQQGLSW
jgi:RNA polymerase sigma-70 factor (ECF subfamily)